MVENHPKIEGRQRQAPRTTSKTLEVYALLNAADSAAEFWQEVKENASLSKGWNLGTVGRTIDITVPFVAGAEVSVDPEYSIELGFDPAEYGVEPVKFRLSDTAFLKELEDLEQRKEISEGHFSKEDEDRLEALQIRKGAYDLKHEKYLEMFDDVLGYQCATVTHELQALVGENGAIYRSDLETLDRSLHYTAGEATFQLPVTSAPALNNLREQGEILKSFDEAREYFKTIGSFDPNFADRLLDAYRELDDAGALQEEEQTPPSYNALQNALFAVRRESEGVFARGTVFQELDVRQIAETLSTHSDVIREALSVLEGGDNPISADLLEEKNFRGAAAQTHHLLDEIDSIVSAWGPKGPAINGTGS